MAKVTETFGDASYPLMTLRDYLAGIALQGLLANEKNAEKSLESVAELAVKYADRLIKELGHDENPHIWLGTETPQGGPSSGGKVTDRPPRRSRELTDPPPDSPPFDSPPSESPPSGRKKEEKKKK